VAVTPRRLAGRVAELWRRRHWGRRSGGAGGRYIGTVRWDVVEKRGEDGDGVARFMFLRESQ